MALLYSTTLVPSKAELIGRWLPDQAWAQPALRRRPDAAAALEVVQLGSFRFDDPGGEVGIETLLVHGPDGVVVQVPVTVRGEPLAGAEQHLIGTAEHGVLGRRWFYDGPHDPVYLTAVVRAILEGGTEAIEEIHADDAPARARTPLVQVQGSGSDTEAPGDVDSIGPVRTETGRSVVRVGEHDLLIARRPEADPLAPADLVLTGRWGDQHATSAVLAALRPAAALPDWYAGLSSALDLKMGLELSELTPERVVGRMPVAGNTQPMGLWHGGASCVLAETLASIGSVAHAMPDRLAVGVDLNATHHRAVRDGWVTGTATALKLGRSVAMYEVVLVDDADRRVCTARVTCQLVDGPRRPPEADSVGG